MNTKPYEELTREDVLKLLDLYNSLTDMLRDTGEGFDVCLSQLRDLQEHTWKLRNRFDFKMQVNEDGGACAWKDYVLKDDDRAYIYKGPCT